MADRFEDFWRRRFPNTPPIKHIVRDAHLERWVRRHALPQSKRYADTPEETEEILRRANVIGDALFSDCPDCWLVQTCFDPGHEPMISGLTFAFYTLDPTDDEVQSKIAIHAGLVSWAAGAFDGLLKEIAEDEFYSVIWISVDSGTVFAPYDGGFDMIFPTAGEAQTYQSFWPEWRSVDKSGW